jgi:N-acetylglucosaminyl-diphospho-decaprenol L-rhamnosyltransferase
MDLSIVIVNWNTKDLLNECLNSVLKEIKRNNDLEIEVLVVDNGSIDGSQDLLKLNFSWVKLIVNKENLGFARANNQAFRIANGRMILLLNSDATLLSNSLQKLVGLLNNQPKACAVGPLYFFPNGTFQASYGIFPEFWHEILLITGFFRFISLSYYPSASPQNSESIREVDWVPGTCMLIKREAIQDVGILDEDFFFYSEEVDWCFRAKEKGWKIWFNPEVKVIHNLGQSAHKNPERSLFYLYRGKILFFYKHHSKFKARILRAIISLVLFVKGCTFNIFEKFGIDHKNSGKMYLRLAKRILFDEEITQ